MSQNKTRGKTTRLQWVIRILILVIFVTAIFFTVIKLMEINRNQQEIDEKNKEKEEIKRECELINDKIKSLPILSLEMEVTEEDYKITIINHSDNPAMDIYIDEYVLGCVDGNKRREFRKNFSDVEWIERECPQKVSLFLRDPRCSCVEMEYVLDSEVYVLKDYNYTSEIIDDYQRI